MIFINIVLISNIYCEGSSVQAVCEDLALSQEDDPPAPADQVGNLSDGYNLTITREIPMLFKSEVGYKAKNTYLDSFQTRSGSSPKLLALVRTINQKERPTCEYQPHYVFRHKRQTSVRKLPSRPMRFKLAYARNVKDRNREGFGMKSCKKAKICCRKANDTFWNPYVFLIMCITMNHIYLRKLVNTWQPVKLPTIASGINKSYAKGKMTPKTCQMGRKRCDKSNGNFWNTYGYVITSICMICIYLTKQVSRLKLVNLQTTTSDLAKLYTMAKIGANSCPMVEKRNHKIHGIFRNAHSYLKGRIIRIGKYLHTLIFGWRSWKPLATPLGGGIKGGLEPWSVRVVPTILIPW